MTSDIDFVIIWVDGADPEWQKQRAMYRCDEERATGENGVERYRDWGILRYWFRAVGKYAPWVRKIHFVTCGQLPEWLNINHPKINFVRHEDYIPHEWLPTFNARTINLNIFRIKDLAEKFVYFDDDMLINAPVKPEDFFVNNLPCSVAVLNPGPRDFSPDVTIIELNNIQIIRKYFDFMKSFKSNWRKWLTLRYGLKYVYKTLVCLQFRRWTGFGGEFHTANSYLKSTFIDVWEKEREVLETTCSHKFRDISDVNQWLMHHWQIASGNFYPGDGKFSRFYSDKMQPDEKPEDVINSLVKELRVPEYKVLCLNDSVGAKTEDAMMFMHRLQEAYAEKLPDKSEFEK